MGLEVLAQMVGVALAPWAGLVVPATPAAFGTSCITAGGGAQGKPRICSPAAIVPWHKAWLMYRTISEAGQMERSIMGHEDI